MSEVGCTDVERFKDGREVGYFQARGPVLFGDVDKTKQQECPKGKQQLGINGKESANLLRDRGRILRLDSAEIKRGSMRGNLRGAMEKVEGDERPREKKGWGWWWWERNRAEQETKRSERTQNEKMIRFTRSETTKFVVVLKNPSLLHLMGTRRGL